MIKSCAQDCVNNWVNFLVGSDLTKKYLHKITPDDVACITVLHEDKHGVPGMLGLINCTHFFEKLPNGIVGIF